MPQPPTEKSSLEGNFEIPEQMRSPLNSGLGAQNYHLTGNPLDLLPSGRQSHKPSSRSRTGQARPPPSAVDLPPLRDRAAQALKLRDDQLAENKRKSVENNRHRDGRWSSDAPPTSILLGQKTGRQKKDPATGKFQVVTACLRSEVGSAFVSQHYHLTGNPEVKPPVSGDGRQLITARATKRKAIIPPMWPAPKRARTTSAKKTPTCLTVTDTAGFRRSIGYPFSSPHYHLTGNTVTNFQRKTDAIQVRKRGRPRPKVLVAKVPTIEGSFSSVITTPHNWIQDRPNEASTDKIGVSRTSNETAVKNIKASDSRVSAELDLEPNLEQTHITPAAIMDGKAQSVLGPNSAQAGLPPAPTTQIKAQPELAPQPRQDELALPPIKQTKIVILKIPIGFDLQLTPKAHFVPWAVQGPLNEDDSMFEEFCNVRSEVLTWKGSPLRDRSDKSRLDDLQRRLDTMNSVGREKRNATDWDQPQLRFKDKNPGKNYCLNPCLRPYTNYAECWSCEKMDCHTICWGEPYRCRPSMPDADEGHAIIWGNPAPVTHELAWQLPKHCDLDIIWDEDDNSAEPMWRQTCSCQSPVYEFSPDSPAWEDKNNYAFHSIWNESPDPEGPRTRDEERATRKEGRRVFLREDYVYDRSGYRRRNPTTPEVDLLYKYSKVLMRCLLSGWWLTNVCSRRLTGFLGRMNRIGCLWRTGHERRLLDYTLASEAQLLIDISNWFVAWLRATESISPVLLRVGSAAVLGKNVNGGNFWRNWIYGQEGVPLGCPHVVWNNIERGL